MASSQHQTSPERLARGQGGPATRSSGKSTQLRDGCLCQDAGTRSSRLAFAPLKQDRQNLEIPYLVQRKGAGKQNFEDSDFPGAMHPFAVDKQSEDCTGFIGDEPDQFPLKIYPYIMRARKLRQRGLPNDLKAVKHFKKIIPQLRMFLQKLDTLGPSAQERVMDHGLAIYISHLRHLRVVAEAQALRQNIRITVLGATFPSNWDNWTQKWFIEILELVWGDSIKSDDIHLIQESHAAANWLMHLTPEMRNARPTQIILADFGGHTFSVEAFHIIYHDDTGDRFSVAALQNTKCVHAGSELHAAHVRDFVQEELTRQAEKDGLPADQATLFKDLMQDYHSKKLELREGQGFGLSCTIESRNRRDKIPPFGVSVSDVVANRFYDLCFNKAFNALERVVNSKTIKKRTTVVFTGGTFYNEHVRKEAQRICEEAGMICPDWTEISTFQNSKTARLVSGAVMCLVNAGSVSDFMSRAAFALRIDHGDMVTPHLIWHGKPYTVTKDLSGRHGGDILLMCSPKGLGGQVTVDGPENTLESSFFEYAYDFKIVDKLRKGKYAITMVYQEANEQESDKIVLTIEYPDSDEPAKTFHWPIFYDNSAGLCLVDYEAETDSTDGEGRSAPWRRAHRKGKAIREGWEQDHKDAGLKFWGRHLEPLADVTSEEIQEALERARQDVEATIGTAIMTSREVTTSSPQPARARQQRQIRIRQRTEKASSTTPAAQTAVGAGRKRRGTSSAHKETTTKQKATRTDQGAGTSNLSFTFPSLNLGANNHGDGSQTNPYAIPASPHQAPMARMSNNAQHIEQANATPRPEGSHPTQGPRSGSPPENNVQEADEMTTAQSRTRSGSELQGMTISQRREVTRSQYRIPTTQPIVSEDLGFQIDCHWANLQKDTNGTK
ncbi:hypothetical protein CC79DRAFT_1369273 [Sarocladium strictum]